MIGEAIELVIGVLIEIIWPTNWKSAMLLAIIIAFGVWLFFTYN